MVGASSYDASLASLICFVVSFFFFNDTATTEIYTLSLHDALPIFVFRNAADEGLVVVQVRRETKSGLSRAARQSDRPDRSEEHTSELQSPCNLVCRLLLEKKKHRYGPPSFPKTLHSSCSHHACSS